MQVSELSADDLDGLWKDARSRGGASDEEVEARDRAYQRARVRQRLTH